jgi:predicted phosphodiesterase
MMKSYLKRQPNESILDYKFRICDKRDEYGLTWADVRAILNDECGENFSAETYRKHYEQWKVWDEHVKGKLLTDDDVFSEIEKKRIELQKDKIRLQDQRRELNKLIRYLARLEYIEEFIERTVHYMAKHKPLEFTPIKYKNFNTEFAGVSLHSDWHVGLFAKNYWNNFDNEELDRRIVRLHDKTLRASQLFNPRELHIFNIGDLVNGLIHVTSQILSTEDVITQTMHVCEILAYLIADYANYFDKIFLYFVNGNHDRAKADKEENLPDESYGRFIPFYLKARLASFTNVEFVENKYDLNIADAEILGHPVLAVHGDKDSTKDVVQNLTLMTGIKPEYIFMGHIHRNFEDEVHQVDIVVNPSLSGVDTHAKEIRRTSKPAQKFMIFCRDEGRYAQFNLRLDK